MEECRQRGNCDGQDCDWNNRMLEDRSSESSLKRVRQNCGDAGDGAMNNEDKNGESEVTLHPLLIEHVVKKILSFFHWSYSNPKILTSRQVCKTWYNIITNGMKRKALVRKLKFDNAECDLLDRFLLDMSNTPNLPFDSFEFDVHFFIKRNVCAFQEFLTTFSPYIVSLSLKFGKHYSMDLVETLENAVTNFCNLKTLSFECIHLFTMQNVIDTSLTRSSFTWQPRHPRDLSGGLLAFLQTILSSADELEVFEIYLPCRYLDGDDGEKANVEFGNVLAEKLPDSVTSLKLTMQINDNHLYGLRRLKLSKLHLDFYGSHLSEKAFDEFLKSQSKSLVDLRLVDLDFDNKLPRHILPDCEKVAHLSIKGEWFPSLKSFPNIEHLLLITQQEPTNDYDKSTEFHNILCPKVLELNLLYPIECSTFITSIPTCFPNIQVLRIQAIPESVRAIEAIFQHVTNLIELEIMFMQSFSKQPVDNIFTGIPLARCYIIGENSMYSREDQLRLLSEIRRKPCLENLRNLKRLIVKSESSSIILTDVTVHYALLRCPSLQEIKFIGNHSISADGFHLLRLRYQVTQQQSDRSPSSGGHAESLENSRALVPVLR